MPHSTDVIVVGGGPAGATASALIAKAGYQVSLLEAQAFPRFHVGESLIPAVNLTLERLGVLDRMNDYRFPNKHGVQVCSPKGPGRPFYFSEATDPRMHQTWQVLRSDFDAMLLDTAVANGVTTFIEVILNQELGEPFRRDAMKRPTTVAGVDAKDMRPQD